MLLTATIAYLALTQRQADAALPRKAWFGAGIVAAGKAFKVTQVAVGSTAEAVGLKVDDVLASVNGVPIDKPQAVAHVFGPLDSGTPVKIEFVRAGKPQTVEAVAKPKPVDDGPGYRTTYDQVVSKGKRIRIFVTRPTSADAGKLPVLFLIQGIGYSSNEQPLTGGSPYAKICRAFSNKGWVTVRVEKPGLGDSEGGPPDKVDFDFEVDAFRQALLKTKSYPFVDPDKVFIFGHSMGGCEGPLLASEIPVKGLAVYGTVIRTWQEYWMDAVRSQGSLSGTSAGDLDQAARDNIAALHLVFNEGLSPKEVKEKFPKWSAAVAGLLPDGEHFSGIGLPFWRGCFAQNYARFWEKLDTNVLSIYGSCDFVAERVDHPLIAEVVNSKHPNRAQFIEIPNSDHAFRNVATKKESLEFWSRGGKDFNPAICDVLLKWAAELLATQRR